MDGNKNVCSSFERNENVHFFLKTVSFLMDHRDITHVRTCWLFVVYPQRRAGLSEQDLSPRLVITSLWWAINHLSVTFQFGFSLNSCCSLELKTSISLTVAGLRVTANHSDCVLFEGAQMNSWAGPADQILTDSDYSLSDRDLPPVLTYRDSPTRETILSCSYSNRVHGCPLTYNLLISFNPDFMSQPNISSLCLR